jgi:hypothetical protein
MVLLPVVVASTIFAFTRVRVTNDVTVDIEHSDFTVEASYGPLSMGFNLTIYGLKSLDQSPESRHPDPDESGGTTVHETRLTIEEKGQEFSQATELSVRGFRMVFQRPTEVVLSSRSVATRHDFGVACKAADTSQKSNGCHANLTLPENELSLCVSHSDFPAQITYFDAHSTKQSKTFSQVTCMRILSDGPLDIAATDGFATPDSFEVELQSNQAFINGSTLDPLLLNTVPVDLKRRIVNDLKIAAGQELDGERSLVSWSLKSVSGNSGKYRFTGSSLNTSFVAANDEQLLQSALGHNAPNHLGRYVMQDIRREIREIPFSVYDQPHSTDLSGLKISCSGLGGAVKVRFHGAFLVPAVQDFIDQQAPLYQRQLLLRVSEEMLAILKDKGTLDQQTQKLEPGQIVDSVLLARKRRRNIYQQKSLDLFGTIQTLEFEPYIERRSKNEKDPKVAEVLTQMLSWLRHQGESEFEIPFVGAADKYPVVMGLEFPDNIDTGIYGAKILIDGRNFKEVEIPFEFEVKDPWTARWSLMWDVIKVLLGATVGGFFGHWLRSRQAVTQVATQSGKTETTATLIGEGSTPKEEPNGTRKSEEAGPSVTAEPNVGKDRSSQPVMKL